MMTDKLVQLFNRLFRNAGHHQPEQDPYWYEKTYINGYYGDLFVRQGGNRKNLKAFGKILLQFGMDLH